ncbi:predicted protein [Naegleria gruberi]|uniref:Predicted protein n=1 Tax=Naegleria gruberi TaxID=5762 RepID=D2VUU3_NAEGR|nr:uncharacterized protein NAEGRDRAFT_72787 [Naegleria gruberi]EFC39321.1 predicted protein [Naegleria gruberi]|eukprot:XP_002672065.1 predicted protein [Naegleria gruberi strain NEG-M]
MENKEEEVKLPPTLLMGASFVNSLENVVFGTEKKDTISKGDELFSIKDLDQNTNNSTIEAMAEQATHSIMEKFEKLNEWNDFDYQQYFATKSPPWKSRFIFNPNEEIPSIEDIKQNEDLRIDTLGEQPHEFDKYLFEDFLDHMDPFINHQLAKPSLSMIRGKQGTLFNPSRVHYILNDIENDRRRIIRNAIDSIKLNKVQ